jgi:hypothetical protein
MATTPATPVIASIPTLSTEWTWIKAHERVILVFMALIVIAFLGSKWLNHDAAKKDAAAIVAQQQVVAAQAATDAAVKGAAAAAAQTAQVTQQYLAMIDSLTRQNNVLAAAAAQRQTALVVQQKAVAAMPPPDLAKRWAALVPTAAPTVTPTGIAVTDVGARDTVVALESIPVYQANLADETTVAANLTQELAGANLLNNTLGVEIVSLNGVIADDKILLTKTVNSDKLELAAVKADARNNSRKWFVRGMYVGVPIGFFLGHVLGF